MIVHRLIPRYESPLHSAAMFAIAAHEAVQQKRKLTGEPYYTHLGEVAQLVHKWTNEPILGRAAWLHDVVEDTPITIDHVRDLFGPNVGQIVAYLTAPPLSFGNRAARMTAYREQLGAAGAGAQTVKCADIVSNTRTAHNFEPAFARLYASDITQSLSVLTRATPVAFAAATRALEEFKTRIGYEEP